MTPRTMLMVAGYREPPEHFNLLRRGTPQMPGLDRFGIASVTFTEYLETLSERIDRFALTITQLRSEGRQFPIALLGYSLGGLVVRGFLRRYPHRADEVSHVVTIATPHWGVHTYILPQLYAMLRIPGKAFGDMDLGSEFMAWLNCTPGHTVRTGFLRYDWKLDREPWIAPPQLKFLSIVGLIPARGGDNDGLVWADSATLGSRIPAHFIAGPHANHLNVIGHFDPLFLIARGFLANDRVWPLTLRAIARFLEAQPVRDAEPSKVS